MIAIDLPFTLKDVSNLKAGNKVVVSGEIFTARDQAHKRIVDLIEMKKSLPVDLKNTVIYYCGPTPEAKGAVIGACGPTTSSRMDPFTPRMFEHGLRFMIGKGERSGEVCAVIKKYRGVYFQTYGGCGAYLHERVIAREVVAFDDLGPEAIYKLAVKDFPLIVAVDCCGNSIFNA